MKDVLIVYELRNREIENACLLASELRYRGYTVGIRNVLSFTRYFIKAKVVVAPHLYNDFQIIAIAKNFWRSHRAIIDLQYEQVLSKSEEGDIHDPKEQAVNAHHIAWGEAQRRRYLDHGIDENHIHISGHIAMDLMRPEFDKYFLSRKVIAEQFSLDTNKKWVLFISSFSYSNRSKRELEAMEKSFSATKVFARISTDSMKEIGKWLNKASKELQNYIFIYRRHPAERVDDFLLSLEKTNPNFRIIDKYSMRQWVRSADLLYTWLSTSIVDAFFAGKQCNILRPLKIPDELDLVIMDESKKICSYDEFMESLVSPTRIFPISSQKIHYYYGDNTGKPAFQTIADLCERLIEDKGMTYNYDYGSFGMNILNDKKIRDIFSSILNRVIFDLCTRITLSKLAKFLNIRMKTIEHFENEGYGINSEINSYISRFDKLITKFHN